MTLEICNTGLSSDGMLNELIFQSLDKILGAPHRVISRDLPFSAGHSILALTEKQQPALIVFDRRDGGQALLTGLMILESLDTHRAWAFRLYPELLGTDKHAWQPEDIQLYLLAPSPPPGRKYLERNLTHIHIFTFQPLLINGDIGLLIEPPADVSPSAPAEEKPAGTDRFRTGLPELEKTEEDYFRNLNIKA